MGYFLPQLENLEGALSQLGQQQLQQGQLAQQNNRANEQLGLQKLAQQRQEEQFQFGVQQQKQMRAMQIFNQALSQMPDTNGQLNAMMQSMNAGDTKSAAAAFVALPTNTMQNARQLYAQLQKSGIANDLPPEYKAIYSSPIGAKPSDIASSIQDIENQQYKATQGPNSLTQAPTPLAQAGSILGGNPSINLSDILTQEFGNTNPLTGLNTSISQFLHGPGMGQVNTATPQNDMAVNQARFRNALQTLYQQRLGGMVPGIGNVDPSQMPQ